MESVGYLFRTGWGRLIGAFLMNLIFHYNDMDFYVAKFVQ